MGKEQTIGMKNSRVNGAMYELPVPVCDWLTLMDGKCKARQILLDDAERLALSQESEIRDYEKLIKILEATLEKVRPLPDEWIERAYSGAEITVSDCANELREALQEQKT